MSRRYLEPTNLFYRESDPTAPPFPEPHTADLYFNTVSKTVRVYYDDGTGFAWRDLQVKIDTGDPENPAPPIYDITSPDSSVTVSNPGTGVVTLVVDPSLHQHPVTSRGRWTYVVDEAINDPGTGNIRTNSGSTISATQVAIAHEDASGADAAAALASLTTDDMIVIQSASSPGDWARFLLTGVPTNNGTWTSIPVSLESSAGTVVKSSDVLVTVSPGGAGGGVEDHGLLTGLGDDDHPQYLTEARGDARYLQTSGGDSRYVNVTGDVMTGSLTTTDLRIDHVGITNEAQFVAGSGNPNVVQPTLVGMGVYVDVSGASGLWITDIPGDTTSWSQVGVSAHNHDGTYVTLAAHGSADHSGLLATKADISHVTSAEDPSGAGDLLHVQYPIIQPADLALSSAIGVSDTLARADHVHKRPTLGELSAAPSSHTHDGADIDTGTVAFGRLPTGTNSTTVAVGDHTHAYVPLTRDLTAGAGLTGGGDLSANRTFNIGAGTGITVNANDIAINRTVVDGWYSATGHGHTGTDDHAHAAYALTGTEVIAGGGLTGGGTLATDRTLAVGAGTGITVNADSVAVDRSTVDGWYDASGQAVSLMSTHTGGADPHTQYQRESEKGAINGYAPLDGSGIIPESYIPAVPPNELFSVANSTERTTFATYTGNGWTLNYRDEVIQEDDGTLWVYVGPDPATSDADLVAGNWTQKSAGGVVSVNGETGAVTGFVKDSRSIVAGSGLTGGGDLTTNVTVNVGQGTGISVSSTAVSIDRGVVDSWYSASGHGHTGTDDHTHAAYVPTTRSLTAGSGLTGGGSLAANRTFNVGAGTGISVAADSVAVNRTVVDGWYDASGTAASLISNHHDAGSNDHDDRYYTESEVDSALSGKSDSSHLHDARYVNTTGDTMTGELRITADFSASGLVRTDDPANFNTKPGFIWIREDDDTGAADPIFNPADYAAVGHLHSGIYSPVGHTHTGDFAAAAHGHTGFADESHTHSGYLAKSGDTATGDLTIQGSLIVPSMVRTEDPPVLSPGILWVDEDAPGTSLGDPAQHFHDDRYVLKSTPNGDPPIFYQGAAGEESWTQMVATASGVYERFPLPTNAEAWWTWTAPYPGLAIINSTVSFGYMNTGTSVTAWIRLNAECTGDYYLGHPLHQRLFWTNGTGDANLDYWYSGTIMVWLNAGATVSPQWEYSSSHTDHPRHRTPGFNMMFWPDNGNTPSMGTISRSGGVVPR